MGVLLVDNFKVNSKFGFYDVFFNDNINISSLGSHYVVDRNVYRSVKKFIDTDNVVLIDATEETKKFENLGPIIESLVLQNLKKDSKVVAIGGGIIQDIVCFIASNYMRGVKWCFIPTTLLSQSDSCIGSKSSINFGNYKNLLGSFTPPNEVYIAKKFLYTLSNLDFKSGLGEILKLYIIGGKDFDLNKISLDNIDKYVYQSLKIKQKFIEEDEFDLGIRNTLNYGHCIGHAIESATNFAIPHGISVSIGMDVVNRFAYDKELIKKSFYDKLREMIFPLYENFKDVQISIDYIFSAQQKDKKNTIEKINLVLPEGEKIKKIGFDNNIKFWNDLKESIKFVLPNAK